MKIQTAFGIIGGLLKTLILIGHFLIKPIVNLSFDI